MGIFTRLFKRDASNSTNTEESYCGGDALLFGQLRNQHSATNLSVVYRCTNLIAESLAVLPIRVNRYSVDCRDEDTAHNLNFVFKGGLNGGYITKFQFIKLLISSVLLKGNGYALIERGADGSVIGLRYLESGDVTIHYDKAKNYLYYTTTVTNKRIEPINMIHLRINSIDGVQGRSVISYATRSITLSNNVENQATKTFGNGMGLNGVLKVEGTLSKQQRTAIHESWNQSMYDGGNGLAVLSGNMSYQPVSMSAEEAQLLQTRAFQVPELCRWFGVSPVLVGDLSHTQYASLEYAQTDFLLHTLSAYIVLVEEEFTAKLFKPSEVGYKIDLDESYILRTDKTSLANYLKTLLDTGVLCVNEARQTLGLNPIEGGDKHLIAYTKIQDNVINDDNKGEDIKDADKQ